MLKLILADDEPLFREYLYQLFNWEELGFEVVGCFKDGQEVLSYIKHHKIDLAILDINMPFFSGIEIVQNSTNQISEFIFVTGYTEFEYAQKAIRLGVSDYIVKPYDRLELEPILKNIRNKLFEKKKIVAEKEKETRDRIKNILPKLLFQNTIDNEDYQKYFSDFNSYLVIVLENIQNETELKKVIFRMGKFFKTHSVYYTKHNSNYLLLFCFSQIINKEIINQHKLSELINTFYFNSRIRLSLGNPCTIDQISINLNHAIASLDQSFFYPDRTVYFENIEENSFSEFFSTLSIRDELNQIINSRELLKIKEFLKLFKKTVFDLSLTKAQLQEVIDILINEHNLIMRNKELNFFMQPIDLNDCLTFFDVSQQIEENLNQTIETIISKGSRHTTHLAKEIKKYIKQNFCNASLNLEIIAENFHLDKSYIRRVFQKEYLLSPTEYISFLRIEKSKILLLDKSKSISDIAFQVGFNDSGYFSKCFKRNTGISPKDFI